MHRLSRLVICLALLLSSALSSRAEPTIAIDGIHALPDLLDYEMDLAALYPQYNFVSFDRERLPIHGLIEQGYTRGNWQIDTVIVELDIRVPALYAALDVTFQPGEIDQMPMVYVRAPDESYSGCNYGVWHLDQPGPGTYLFIFLGANESVRYRIGTGPCLWETYPPQDYSAVLLAHGFTWAFFRGFPLPHSDLDNSLLQQYVDDGGGFGLIWDAVEPIAEKPVIRLSGFERGADVRIDIPGRLTYRAPDVLDEAPAHWRADSRGGEEEILYEAAFKRPLNFVTTDAARATLSNHSWATVRDARLIEFEPNRGYRFRTFGTLEPGAAARSGAEALYNFMQAREYLDRVLREEAADAGLTKEQVRSFFDRYGWTDRVLADASRAGSPLCLYRIEGTDYDGLLPLSVSPRPAETVRALWVYSMLPADDRRIASVHPRVPSTFAPALDESQGRYHEYGFFRERYGGSLDELEGWGWHFYDAALWDSSDFNQSWECVNFSSPGASPLSATILDGVQAVEGFYSAGVTAESGAADVILSGDEDTQSWDTSTPFPAGSFPPVVVGREEAGGGRVVGYSDLQFFADSADNVLMSGNMLSWLTGGATGHGADIDLPDAVAEATVVENATATSTFAVTNLGDQTLAYTCTPPDVEWVTITGPTENTLEPGATETYSLEWSRAGLTNGFYTALWPFTTNDANEAELAWPLRLEVITAEPAPEPVLPPTGFRLLAAYPNPFNSEVHVDFALERSTAIAFVLYNTLGQQVETVSRATWIPGEHRLRIDLSGQPAGLYFLNAQSDDTRQIQKLLLLK